MDLKQPDYSKFAEYYDAIELGGGKSSGSAIFLDKIFRKNKIKTILDMTCGTGAQSIGLSKKGYQVTASDLNKEMLYIAKKKGKYLGIKFSQGDIRSSRFGEFDAVIAMFNSIGHLSRKDFEKAVRNVWDNLKTGGLFVFDIFDLDYMRNGSFIDHRFIDVSMAKEGKRFVRFNKNNLNFRTGIMRIDQETWIQKGLGKPEIWKENWDLQIYTKEQLKAILEHNGFKVVRFYSKQEGLFIFTVAKKV